MKPGSRIVMVATSAFGLGIDKPDIRYIMHYQAPGVARAVRAGSRPRRPRRPQGATASCSTTRTTATSTSRCSRKSRVRPDQLYRLGTALAAWKGEGRTPDLDALALSAQLSSRVTEALLAILEEAGLVSLADGGGDPDRRPRGVDRGAIGEPCGTVRDPADSGRPTARPHRRVRRQSGMPRGVPAPLLRRGGRGDLRALRHLPRPSGASGKLLGADCPTRASQEAQATTTRSATRPRLCTLACAGRRGADRSSGRSAGADGPPGYGRGGRLDRGRRRLARGRHQQQVMEGYHDERVTDCALANEPRNLVEGNQHDLGFFGAVERDGAA